MSATKSFATQAKEQADYAFSLIPDDVWNGLKSSGVDKEHFRQTLTSVTQADLSVIQSCQYCKFSRTAHNQLIDDLDSYLPDVDDTATEEKRNNNRKVAIYNKTYGIYPDIDFRGWTCKTTNLHFPAFIPGWKGPDSQQSGSGASIQPYPQLIYGVQPGPGALIHHGPPTCYESEYGSNDQGSDAGSEVEDEAEAEEAEESSVDSNQVLFKGRLLTEGDGGVSVIDRVGRKPVIVTAEYELVAEESDTSDSDSNSEQTGVSIK